MIRPRTAAVDPSFERWRVTARRLLALGRRPDEAGWSSIDRPDSLFAPGSEASCLAGSEQDVVSGPAAHKVPGAFVNAARYAACHRDADRWSFLYRILWRLTRGGEPHLLHIAVDEDVAKLFRMVRQVRRDRHKMTAFVRFRKVKLGDGEHFIAWHIPDHHIVRLASDHFVSRFGSFRWSILTPLECVHWDGDRLEFTAGATRDQAPKDDELESLWLTYYANIFNPARIKLAMMRREMPVRHWPTLPETRVIPEMLADAPGRVREMISRTRVSELPVPSKAKVPATTSLAQLHTAAGSCSVCSWASKCTQSVFGSGAHDAKVVFVGEQPGDQEDIRGVPFVGPAGEVFDSVLDEVGIDRDALYVTNAVKHFKFEPRGERRIHQKPDSRDIEACRPWLVAELEIIRPSLLVCLGASAAKSLLGPEVRITKDRGKPVPSRWAPWTLITFHPSAILRARDIEAGAAMRRDFVADLTLVAQHLSRGAVRPHARPAG